MRAVKIGGIALGAFVVLVALALISVRLFVNPNDFKGRIEQLVKRSTGRELELTGELHLSVFPWIAIELGPASLGNPPGFGTQPFLSVKHIALRVRLLPLLREQLRIGRIQIDGLDVRLAKDAQGRGNWEGLMGAGGGKASQSSTGASSVTLAALAGVQIRNARIQYRDLVADHADLTIGRVTAGRPVPVHLSLELSPRRSAKPLAIDAKLLATIDPANHRYRLSSVKLKGTLAARTGGSTVPWNIAAPNVQIDLGAQTLKAPSVTVAIASAHLTTSVQATHILGSPVLQSSFTLAPVSPRALLTHLGYAPPQTRDPHALSSLAARGRLIYRGSAARVADLDVKLDDSTLRGNAAVTNLATKTSRFDLSLDHIDFDRYRGATPSSSAAATPAAGQSSTSLIPTALIRLLDTAGQLTIGSAIVDGVHLRNVHLGVAAHGGVLHIAPATAGLYGGRYSGDLTLNVRGPVPQATLEQQLSDIDVAGLLEDFAKTRRLVGRGNVTARLTARGRDSKAMLASLSGHVAANLRHGALQGLDLGFQVERAIALITKHTLPGGSDSGRTAFETFRASADLHQGVATTRDLDIVSPSLRVTGGGTANLVSNAIDYQVKARLLSGSAGAHSAALIDVPLVITGTFSSPTVRPDLKGLGEALVRQQFRKRKGELEHKLLNRLKGLLK